MRPRIPRVSAVELKNLLLLLDTDPLPSAFDQVVAHDAGADAVLPYGGVDADNCFPLVEGAIYTRPPQHKRRTAILVGGSDLARAEAVYAAVRGQFFGDFRVSVMLDANGCNTTAAAAVATVEAAQPLAGARAAVLAGTGPVGQRAAAMLALSGAAARLSSRRLERAEAACAAIRERFGRDVEPRAAADAAGAAAAIDGAELALACGQTGVRLLARAQWTDAAALRVAADVGTCPPLGVEGLEPGDRGREEGGVRLFGGLAIGALKLRLQRAAVARLFAAADQTLDAAELLAMARELQSA